MKFRCLGKKNRPHTGGLHIRAPAARRPNRASSPTRVRACPAATVPRPDTGLDPADLFRVDTFAKYAFYS